MKQNYVLLLCLTLLICGSVTAQHNFQPKKIGITYSSFGVNEVFRTSGLDGDGSYDSKSFCTIGVNYIHPLSNWLEMETGVEYARHTISITSSPNPNVDKTSRNASFSLVNIPLTVKANFLKLFFVNGGVFLDIDVSKNSAIDSQTGLGTMLGIGMQYEFGNGVNVFVNPYTKVHALVPFVHESYHQRLLETGVRFGVMFVL